MTYLSRNIADSPRRAVATALLVLIVFGMTATVALMVAGSGSEPFLREQIVLEHTHRTALERRLRATETSVLMLKERLDSRMETLRSIQRQRDVARRARRATTARLTALRKTLDSRTRALRSARRERDIADRASERATRDAAARGAVRRAQPRLRQVRPGDSG